MISCPPSVFGVCANERAFPVIFPVGPAWTLRLEDNAVLLPKKVVELSDIVTPPAVALVNVVPTTKLLKLIVLVHVGADVGLAEGLTLGVDVVGVEVEGDVLGLEVVGDSLGVEVVGVTVVGDVLGVDVVGLKVGAVGPTATAVVVGVAVEGAMVPEHGPISSQACAHAPPYVVEKGSNPTWLHSLSRVGIAAVDLHFKICPFLDTKLPATYAVPTTHSLGQPGLTTAVVGAMVPKHGPIVSQANVYAPPADVDATGLYASWEQNRLFG